MKKYKLVLGGLDWHWEDEEDNEAEQKNISAQDCVA